MRVCRGLRRIPRLAASCVCLGVFDALHPGHQAIIRATTQAARRQGRASVVVTLYPHPSALLRPTAAVPLVLTLKQRLERIAELNPDYCVILPFNHALARMPARRFLDGILSRRLRARWICVGEDFRFGAGGAGDVGFLKEWGRASGVMIRALSPIRRASERVSSSNLRARIRAGRVEGARRIFGHYPEWVGRVTRGDGIASRRMATPTLNLKVQNELLPAAGVYAGVARLDAEKRRHRAVIHVGPRPTLGRNENRFEVHLLKGSVRWRNRIIRVELHAFIRPIQKFPSLAALKRQIQTDIVRAQELIDKK